MKAILVLLLACGGGDVLPALAPPEAEVVLRVVDKKVGEGEPVVVEVEAISAQDWSMQVGAPSAEGLERTLVETEGPMQVGERSLTRRRYHLTGAPGSYIVTLGPSGAAGPSDQNREFSPPPVFVDIGVAGPSGGSMVGLEGPPADTSRHWTFWAAIAAAVAAVAGLLFWIFRRFRSRKTVPPEVPPDPPHVIALRDWGEGRKQGHQGLLDDPALALELSWVLRVYLEAICAWPATARTTREILGFLEREGAGARRLDVTDRMRTGRILDATDRLKFAREGGGEPFFVALDEDFHAVIRATRPLAMSEVADA